MIERIDKISFEVQWHYIALKINWEMIYRVMKLMDWEWEGFGIPCVGKIKEGAKGICERAWTEETNVSSGGFACEYDKEEKKLSLKFVIAECYVAEYI